MDSFPEGFLSFVAAVRALDALNQVSAEEQQHVQKRHHKRDAGGGRAHHEAHRQPRRVDQRQILHPDRAGRRTGSLGSPGTAARGPGTATGSDSCCGVAGDHAGDDRAQHAEEVVHVEPERAPLVLQRAADHPVEAQRKQNPHDAGIRRQEQEGHQPPELDPQDRCLVEHEIGRQVHRHQHVQHKDRGHEGHDVHNQIGDGILPEFPRQSGCAAACFTYHHPPSGKSAQINTQKIITNLTF